VAGLGEFARRIRQIGISTERNVNEVVRRVGLVAHRELVFSTPVDTGRARSNWVVDLVAPTEATFAPFAPGEQGSTGAANAQAALAAGETVINRREPGQDLFLSNNLPYIGRLNEGYSAQAPAGFVEAALIRATTVVQSAKVVGNGN